MPAEPAALRVLDRPLHRYVVRFAAVYLVLAWLAVVAIDALNVVGLRDRLVAMELDMPHVWYHLFADGHLPENLQWLALGGTAIVATLIAGLLFARGRTEPATFWLLMAVAATLLLIEDAGNPRHRLASYVVALAPGERTPRILAELTFFALLAAVPLYAVARYWRWPWRSAPSRGRLVGALGLYGLAAIASGTRDIGGAHGWYAAAGRFLEEAVFQGRLLQAAPFFGDLGPDATGYLLMDLPVAESVELVAAALLLAAALAYACDLRRDPTLADPAS
jgi:hypothetical protein